MRWGRRRAEARPSGTVRTRQDESAQPGFLVEEYDRLVLLRRFSDELLVPADIADLTRILESDGDGTMTVVAGADEASAPALWPRLAALLDTLRGDGVGTIRLAMSGAGDERPGLPSVARRIADAWGFDVIAPDGTVLGVPGGGLFVHELPPGSASVDRERGWWLFSPGAPPVPLGPRQPAPDWQPAPGSLPSRTRNGCVVQHIPAGVLIRPDRARAPRPDDLCFAVPVDRRGLLVVVGVPDGEDVVTDDVADVVTALSETARAALRLAPGGQRDVLRVGQGVAELTDAEVVVYSGLPLLADSGLHRDTVRSMAVGTDGTPSWQPFVDSVVCAPGNSAPRLLRWTPPLPGPGNAQRGLVRLSDRWQVTATRAGLWISGTDSEPVALPARPVDARGPEIEVGRPGEVLDRSLSPVLERLLAALPPGMSSRARMHVHGTAADGGQELRRLAAQYQVRSLRFAAFARTAPAEPRPAQSTGEPASHPATSQGEPRQPVVSSSPGPATNVPAANLPAANLPAVNVPTANVPLPRSPMPAAGSVPLTGIRPDAVTAPAGAGAPAATGFGGSHEPAVPVPPSGAATRPPSDADFGADGDPGRAAGPALPPTPPRHVPTVTATPPGPTGVTAGVPATVSELGTHARPDRNQPLRTSGLPAAPAVPAASAPPQSNSAAAAASAAAGHVARAGGSAGATGPTGIQQTRPQARPVSSPLAADPDREPHPDRGAHPVPVPRRRALPEPEPEPDNARTTPEHVSAPDGATSGTATAATAPTPSSALSSPPAIAPTGPASRGAEANTTPAVRGSGQDTGREEASSPGPPVRPSLTCAAPGRAEEPHGPEAPPARAPGAPTTPPVPDTAPVQQPARPAPVQQPASPAQPLPAVPFQPGHQSTPAERAAFRALADAVWDRQAAVVTRTFTRMPALRGHEQEAARADLVALLLYLRTSDGPLGHEELDRCLRTGDPRLLPYAACVASALRRLPSFRGPALRGTGGFGNETIRTPAPGAVLRDPAPVGALPSDGSGAYPASTRYAIWSVTGRRVRQLFGATGSHAQADEVVFAPGTVFKVLDVRGEGPSPLVLLRELPVVPGAAPLSRTQLDDQDRSVLARLDEALAQRPSGSGTFEWPGRCAGPVGSLDH
ncbi:hypothetical protein [Streptomyces sp. NPDC127084]|uniref:hypothetical protein n=1 Tax=Streptomyces sp. NPDC127084 TaxID=3347133 RepID=UPI003649E68E